MIFAANTARADDDSWINPGSGAWENGANWGLGLPNTNLYVVIDNPGWKAVAISANTANNFPDSMTVQRLILGSPVDSYNVLLLNYAGYAVPFRANEIIISNNATMTVLGSMVQVTNVGSGDYRIEVSGTLNHGENSSVNTTFLSIGNFGAGVYNLTNGVLYGASEYIGGAGYPATFNQFGGYHTAPNMRLVSASYYLEGGALDGSIEFLGGAMQQDGGLCTAWLDRWNYTLNGGVFTNGGLGAGWSSDGSYYAHFVQNGGSNLMAGLSMGQSGNVYDSSGGTYTLNQGYFITGDVTLLGDGSFYQTGSVAQINGTLRMDGGWLGYRGGYIERVEGYYQLDGGLLNCNKLLINDGNFLQRGGTNIVSGSLICSNYYVYVGPGYNLMGGTLQTPSVSLFLPMRQSGGLHQVQSTLTVSGLQPYPSFPVRYHMDGGTLSAPLIVVTNQAEFAHTSGTVVGNNRLILAGGSWLCATGTTQLGALSLDVAGSVSNSFLSLSNNTSFRFSASTGQAWSPSARLVIQNWHGSLQGGGLNSVNFGSGGLTAAQVAQIQFQDPGGAGDGMYPARLLPNGEVVPGQALFWHPGGNKLVLEWPAGAILQSASNVAGPYYDMTSVTSPYTNQSLAPLLFFRIRM